MNLLDGSVFGSLVTALGWTLLHFVWQGALIGGLLAATLSWLRRRGADARYLACCAAMALMMIAPAVTFVVLMQGRAEPFVAAPAAMALDTGPVAVVDRLAAILPQLTLLWLLGVSVLGARSLWQWSCAQRMKRRGTVPAPAVWRRTVADLCERLAIRPPVRICESTLACVPMLIGWLRPVILVPAGMVTGLSPGQLRAVLAHELAHVRRHDYLVNLVQAVLESLLFYHPAVWWLSGRLREEREYCCDDVAVSVGGDALAYAQALSYLDSLRGDHYQPALASTGGPLMHRIQRLLGVKTKTSAAGLLGWMAPLAITLVMVAALSAMTLAPPSDEPEGHWVEAPYGEAHGVDVVAILREIGVEEAQLVALLREVGLDNRTLLMVMESIGTDERVIRALGQAFEVEHLHESKLHEAREHVTAKLAAGLMTEAEAEAHLDGVRIELHDHFRARASEHHVLVDTAERQLIELRRHLEDELGAGRISENEAKRRLDRAREEIHARLAERKVHRTMVAELFEMHVAEIHRQIETDLAEGLITQKQARERMRQAKRDLHAKLVGELADRLPIIAQRLGDIQREIKDQVMAGLITEKEAHERLGRAKRELHAKLLLEFGARGDDVEDRFRVLHQEIEEQLKAGLITEKGARERLWRVTQELHEHLKRRQHDRRSETEKLFEKRMDELHRQLRADLEAGLITEKEARRRLDAARKELHEKLIAETHERHRHPGKNDRDE